MSLLLPLSVLEGVQASALRTPDKLALVMGDRKLDYATLAATVQDDASLLSLVAPRLLPRPSGESLGVRAPAAVQDELDRALLRQPPHPPSPHGGEGEEHVPAFHGLSNRAVVLRILNAAVMYAAFSRDTRSVSALPLDRPEGIVAALAPLYLGGTVTLLEPGDTEGLVRHIADGTADQAWFGPADLAALPTSLPSVPQDFRAAIATSQEGAARLVAWLGPDRMFAEATVAGVPYRLTGHDLAAGGAGRPALAVQ